MTRHVLLACALLFASACGGSNSGQHADQDVIAPVQQCPPGSSYPSSEADADGHVIDCEATFEGCCFPTVSAACQAAGCGDDCSVAETHPAQVTRCAPRCPPGGAAPVEGPDGVPLECAVLFEGCCYADSADACRAANCAADECRIAASYPGQLGRCE